jgi:hypothetical protein
MEELYAKIKQNEAASQQASTTMVTGTNQVVAAKNTAVQKTEEQIVKEKQLNQAAIETGTSLGHATTQATEAVREVDSLCTATQEATTSADALKTSWDKVERSVSKAASAASKTSSKKSSSGWVAGASLPLPEVGETQYSYNNSFGTLFSGSHLLVWSGSEWVSHSEYRDMLAAEEQKRQEEELSSAGTASSSRSSVNIIVNQQVSRSDIVNIASDLDRMERR